MADAVLTSAVDGVLVITLNRPEVRNAIDSALSLGVHAALATLDADDSLRVGVLTGAGGTFCAGMDLKAFAVHGLPVKVDDVLRHGCRKPLVAAIEGLAVGGGLELALIADLVVAARDARSDSPEVRFGLFPGGGALLRLPRLLPQSIVAELALTGELMSAQVAHSHGLVVRLCDPGHTLDTALELAGGPKRNSGRSRARWSRPCSTPRTHRRARVLSPRSGRRSGPDASRGRRTVRTRRRVSEARPR